jgi:hypothetical protein
VQISFRGSDLPLCCMGMRKPVDAYDCVEEGSSCKSRGLSCLLCALPIIRMRWIVCSSVRSACAWRVSMPCLCQEITLVHEQRIIILITRLDFRLFQAYPTRLCVVRVYEALRWRSLYRECVDTQAHVEGHPHVATRESVMKEQIINILFACPASKPYPTRVYVVRISQGRRGGGRGHVRWHRFD